MAIAYWILNYEKYDPSYNPNEWEYVFRNNMLNVTSENINEFLQAIEVDRVYENQFEDLKAIPNNLKPVYFFVDLDAKQFVSNFPEIEVEEYLSNNDWCMSSKQFGLFLRDSFLITS